MTGQLIFDLPTSENYNPQDYFVSSSNNNAAKLIKIFPEWHNNGIVIFGLMCSGPIIVQVLEGENAVLKNREVMGATNPEDADEGTIRKQYINIVHIDIINKPTILSL